MIIQEMIVFKIVLVNGVVVQFMMNAAYAVVMDQVAVALWYL